MDVAYRAFALTSCCPPTWHRIAQTDLDIQGSHAHHARTRSSCAWTTNGEVHGETVTHNNVKRCLHKWILISVAIESGPVGGQHDVTWKRSISALLKMMFIKPTIHTYMHWCKSGGGGGWVVYILHLREGGRVACINIPPCQFAMKITFFLSISCWKFWQNK